MPQIASKSDPVIQYRKKTLDAVARIIEKATGFRWLETSFIRNSPSHWNGSALDIAPDIIDIDKSKYGPYMKTPSDPVLPKRRYLVDQLAQVPAMLPPSDTFTIGIFLETDHIHIGLFKPGSPHSFYSWEDTKPVYTDTYERHELPDAFFDQKQFR